MSSHEPIAVKISQGTHFDEANLATGLTPLPGTCVKRSADGEVNTTVVVGDELLILTEDEKLGGLKDTAYTDSARVQFFSPLPGDQFQVLVESGDVIAYGDRLRVQAADGIFEVNAAGSVKALEGFTATATEKHVLVVKI